MDRIEKRKRFVLGGVTYEHAGPAPGHDPGRVRRFALETEPKVTARVPLAGGGTVEVHGYATHYTRDWVTVVWNDDNVQHFDCWVPAADVRRVTDSEWDIWEFHRCPEKLRAVRWGGRLPGFLPE